MFSKNSPVSTWNTLTPCPDANIAARMDDRVTRLEGVDHHTRLADLDQTVAEPFMTDLGPAPPSRTARRSTGFKTPLRLL